MMSCVCNNCIAEKEEFARLRVIKKLSVEDVMVLNKETKKVISTCLIFGIIIGVILTITIMKGLL